MTGCLGTRASQLDTGQRRRPPSSRPALSCAGVPPPGVGPQSDLPALHLSSLLTALRASLAWGPRALCWSLALSAPHPGPTFVFKWRVGRSSFWKRGLGAEGGCHHEVTSRTSEALQACLPLPVTHSGVQPAGPSPAVAATGMPGPLASVWAEGRTFRVAYGWAGLALLGSQVCGDARGKRPQAEGSPPVHSAASRRLRVSAHGCSEGGWPKFVSWGSPGCFCNIERPPGACLPACGAGCAGGLARHQEQVQVDLPVVVLASTRVCGK